MANKKNEYWAGFESNKLCESTYCGYHEANMPSLFKSRRAAKLEYADVRKVRVTQVKRSKGCVTDDK